MMFSVRVSYLEIYNENIIDLLSESPNSSQSASSSNPKQTAPVVEDGDNGAIIRNLNVQEARTEAEALDYFFEGEVNRTLAVHQLNKYSTR
jgi:kinesin family protein 11